jgi:hypothetical protein
LTDHSEIIQRLPALLRGSPNIQRNIDIVTMYLDGTSLKEIGRSFDLSATRIVQILRQANNRLGGGLIHEDYTVKRPPSAIMREKYPCVWDIANKLGLSRQAAVQFYRALGQAGSLEQLELNLSEKPASKITRQIFDNVTSR